jgi:hypothetical protein
MSFVLMAPQPVKMGRRAVSWPMETTDAALSPKLFVVKTSYTAVLKVPSAMKLVEDALDQLTNCSFTTTVKECTKNPLPDWVCPQKTA